MWRGTLSLRRLNALISNLPPDCALSRAIDPEVAAWSVTDHLLATVIDTLQTANWQRGGDANAARPKPFPRPGRTRRDTDAIAARARAFKARKENR